MTTPRLVRILYTNWRGVTASRVILPKNIVFTCTKWHPEPQWLLEAEDRTKHTDRQFAIKDILEWKPVPGPIKV